MTDRSVEPLEGALVQVVEVFVTEPIDATASQRFGAEVCEDVELVDVQITPAIDTTSPAFHFELPTRIRLIPNS